MLRRFVVVLGVAPIALPGSARADEFSLHALLSSQLAGSDTSFEDGTGGDFAWSYQLRPGILFTYTAHRHSHELSIESGVDGAGFQTEGIALGYRAALRDQWTLTPRLDANTGISAAGGLTNAFTLVAPANTGNPNVLPQNSSEYFSAEVSESMGYILTPRMNIRESGYARYLQTVGGMFDTVGWDAGGTVGIDRSFRTTAVGLEGRGAWQRLGTDEALPGVLLFREQLDLRGVLRIRRDFSPRWSGAIEGGVLHLIPLQDAEQRVTEPIGSVEVAYFPAWGQASFAVRHTAGPNLFLAQNEISDSAVINAALPIPSAYLRSTRLRPTLTLLTSLGASYTRFLSNLTGESVGRFSVVYADAALSYLPQPHLAISVRFQFISQSATEDAIDPMLNALGYTRNTFMLTFAGRWPERQAVEMPVRSRVRVREITPVGEDNVGGIGGGSDR